jgi:PQQ-like domain
MRGFYKEVTRDRHRLDNSIATSKGYFSHSWGKPLEKQVAITEGGGIEMSRFKRTGVQIQQLIRFGGVAAAILTAGIILSTGTSLWADGHDEFNKKGNIVIADQFNNRVIEIDPETHNVVWQFGDGSDKPGAHSIVGTNDAERVGEFTLISGTGIPAATPGCSDSVNGCPDNRVIVVNEEGHIVWQYGQDGGVAGAGPNQLNVPVAATFLPNGNILITDQSNERVIEVNREKEIVWQYGVTGVTGSAPCTPGVTPGELNNPNSAELLENGHVLIADENNNRVIEVDRTCNIIHTYTAGNTVSGAAFASRLENGNTLITDSNNSRIVEVDANDSVVWQYFTNSRPGSIKSPFPTRAVRLRDGNTLISDQFNNQVIEVTHEMNIVFTQGSFLLGNGFDELNGPYDAKVVGDFTGLTRPPKLKDDFSGE